MPRTDPGLFSCTLTLHHRFNRRFEFGGVVLGGVLSLTIRKRGNPNWGRSGQFPPAMATAFEMQARQLHLIPETYTSSAELRTWCERNRNNFYIPEWLLDEWEIRVNADLTSAA